MNTKLKPLRPFGEKRPLFCFPGAGGEDWVFHNFAECMREGQPVYVVNMRPFYEDRDHFMIDGLARQCLEIVSETQEFGPYYLCGYSFGGYVAYEVAALLLERGQKVGVLALFDAANPAFQANLSTAESAQFRATYFGSRMKKYFRNLFTGDFSAFLADAVAYLSPRLGALWPWVASGFRFFGKPLPVILQNNDPIVTAACRVYRPSRYAGRLTIFRSLARGPEYDRDPTLGWDKYVAGGIDVHFIPGSHVNMMGPPSVTTLVELLEPYLDGGESRSAK